MRLRRPLLLLLACLVAGPLIAHDGRWDLEPTAIDAGSVVVAPAGSPCRPCSDLALVGSFPRGAVAPGRDREGRVGLADVVRLLRWSVGLEPAPIDDDLIRADIGSGSASPEARGDGRVDIGDVVRALRLSVDLEVVDWPARSSFEGRGPCAPALVELHHEGDLPLMLLDLELEGDASGDWLVEGPPLPHELAPDDVVVLRLVFVPTMPGARQAQLRVTTDDEEVPEQLVSLEGLGVAPGPPRLEVLPTELSFGELPLAMTSGPGLLVVSNAGGEPLVLTSLELNGPDAPDFDLEPPVLPLELAVGGRVELLVTVTPSLSGLRQAELIVESSEPDGPTVVPLTVVSLPPVSFAVEEVFEVATPTRGVWGPDERLWVATIGGAIHALSFDDDWALQDVETFDALTELPNPHVLGLAFSPFDAPGALRLLVAHSLLEANGGECFEGSSDFTGQVSVLTGPDFDEVEPLITGLPVSNHDHGINGLELDSQGRLLVCVGGLTNAGVADCAMGGLPESPLSAAIVRAAIDEPGFEGAITYIHVDTGLPVDDQVLGEEIELADDVAVEVFASGLRNVFDLHLTTRDVLFALDNGPNGSLGPASLSATTEGPGPGEADELILLEEGHYYGHPNRSRGREDDRQNVYHRPVGASVPGAFTQALVRMPPSSNGLDEYRAATFGSQLRGHLIAQDFNEETYHVELSGDGRRFVDRRVLLEDFGGLDVVTAPGGVIFGIDFVSGVVRLARPQHATAVGVELFDIHPWRAPPEGGTSFVLAGRGFGALAETELRIDGRLAALTEVTPTRIRGAIPMRGDEPLGLLDVTVTTSGESTTLTDAFRYLSPVMPGARVD
ncbi:MAG: choice-of-anchor D domain-containing protein, partial [Acidobacteriota bacterium]